jgi:hypothetical protein
MSEEIMALRFENEELKMMNADSGTFSVSRKRSFFQQCRRLNKSFKEIDN